MVDTGPVDLGGGGDGGADGGRRVSDQDPLVFHPPLRHQSHLGGIVEQCRQHFGDNSDPENDTFQ